MGLEGGAQIGDGIGAQENAQMRCGVSQKGQRSRGLSESHHEREGRAGVEDMDLELSEYTPCLPQSALLRPSVQLALAKGPITGGHHGEERQRLTRQKLGVRTGANCHQSRRHLSASMGQGRLRGTLGKKKGAGIAPKGAIT